MLKAYIVYELDPFDSGCFLVYANTVNQAKMMGCGEMLGAQYIHMRARRQADFDQYATEDEPHIINDNSELPDGCPPFYQWEI